MSSETWIKSGCRWPRAGLLVQGRNPGNYRASWRTGIRRDEHRVLNEWLQIACRADVVRRSSKVAVMVGTILVTINYGDRVLAGDIGLVDITKMALTYCVPYCVSTYASVSAVLGARAAARD